ncbi:type II toxin-antitoxin system RelE/ParE family toxin [Adlercreutzia murintestinalis]|uniref:type II toxin-antitoxin system RelE/ParE family toxin n=1 Tax=Adlercreutzia murintestinalis TaxID=2941325 RepID=UPI00203A4B39|nr:type II toxin-antitoxin system YafQ family toxin [Adlercreutzia murintestinalis]
MLEAQYTAQFLRDTKRLTRKRVDLAPLRELINLILSDTAEARQVLDQRHNMHRLKGEWIGHNECHVANAGDWLVIWKTGNGLAVFQRTGSHDELFR